MVDELAPDVVDEDLAVAASARGWQYEKLRPAE